MNKLRALITTVAIAVVTTVTAQADNKVDKQVSFDNDGTVLTYETKANTLEEFLSTQDASLFDNYVIDADLNTVLEDENTFNIEEKISVKIITQDADPITLKYQKGITVEEIIEDLESQNVGKTYVYETGENDKVIETDYILHLNSGDVEVITKLAPLSYETQKIETNKLYIGDTKVQTEGVNGLHEVEVTKKYFDGELVERTEETVNVHLEPITEVILVGTKARGPLYLTNQNASVNVEDLSYKKAITMNASAYTSNYASTGKSPGDKYYGITASGMVAQRGVVAVDPKVIPLGTELYVEGYGYAIAGDTGGSIKGNKIDLYMDSAKECTIFGRRNIKVYVLN